MVTYYVSKQNLAKQSMRYLFKVSLDCQPNVCYLFCSARDLEKQHQYTNPIHFYDFFMNRIVVAFKPRFEDQEFKSEFELTLSKKMTYDQVSSAQFKQNCHRLY